jgi:hypothetical protein
MWQVTGMWAVWFGMRMWRVTGMWAAKKNVMTGPERKTAQGTQTVEMHGVADLWTI